jgi:hypothetical protein
MTIIHITTTLSLAVLTPYLKGCIEQFKAYFVPLSINIDKEDNELCITIYDDEMDTFLIDMTTAYFQGVVDALEKKYES